MGLRGMRIVLLVGVCLYAGGASAETKSRHLYRYDIEVTEAPQRTADDVSRVVASFLADKRLQRDCVDLRSLGSAESGHVEHGTIGVILNEPIRPSELQELRNFICGGSPRCKVETKSREVALGQVKLASRMFEEGSSHTHGPQPTERAQCKPDSPMPRFSRACSTGKYSDSWNDAASTASSRKYLADIGIRIERSRTLDLEASGKAFWTFGFPDHDRDGSGGTTGDDSSTH